MPREKLSATVDEEVYAEIEERHGPDGDHDSRSAAVDHLLKRGLEAEALEDEVERLEARVEELE